MSKLNRLNIRFKLGNITIFGMIAKTQTLSGISSRVGYDKNIILWDLDNCTLKEAIKALEYVQQKYNLSDIYIFGDRDNGFNASCFTIVSYNTLLRILIDTDYIDNGFISYTAKRMKATLRMCRKENRPEMEIKHIIYSHYAPMPKDLEIVIYDTGLVKDGITIGMVD